MQVAAHDFEKRHEFLLLRWRESQLERVEVRVERLRYLIFQALTKLCRAEEKGAGVGVGLTLEPTFSLEPPDHPRDVVFIFDEHFGDVLLPERCLATPDEHHNLPLLGRQVIGGERPHQFIAKEVGNKVEIKTERVVEKGRDDVFSRHVFTNPDGERKGGCMVLRLGCLRNPLQEHEGQPPRTYASLALQSCKARAAQRVAPNANTSRKPCRVAHRPSAAPTSSGGSAPEANTLFCGRK